MPWLTVMTECSWSGSISFTCDVGFRHLLASQGRGVSQGRGLFARLRSEGDRAGLLPGLDLAHDCCRCFRPQPRLFLDGSQRGR